MDDQIAYYVKARGASVWCAVVKGRPADRTACDRDCSTWAFMAHVAGFSDDGCPNCESALATTIPATSHAIRRHSTTLISKVRL